MDFPTEQMLTVEYRNYRGETSIRRIVPDRIWFGSTDWHPEAQWLLDGFDVDKDAYRSFAILDVTRFLCDDLDDVPTRSRDQVAS